MLVDYILSEDALRCCYYRLIIITSVLCYHHFYVVERVLYIHMPCIYGYVKLLMGLVAVNVGA